MEIIRAVDNRPISFRSQVLFCSISEMKHGLRQHNLRLNQRSRGSITLFP